jgi:single-strand DNA-binding protein
MASLNKIILIGRLTANPEIKSTNDGISLAKFTIAVERVDKSEGVTGQTDFFNVIAWRNLADKVQNQIQKGSLVVIEGIIITRSFETEPGKRKWSTEIEAKDIRNLEGTKNRNIDFSESEEGSLSSLDNIEKKIDIDANDVAFDFGNPQFGVEVEEENVPF